MSMVERPEFDPERPPVTLPPFVHVERPRVLLVEDDPGDALLVRVSLEEAGYPADDILWERTYADAIGALQAGPGCVLLDLGLPDIGGLPAVRALATAAGDIPVIVLTGRQERDGAAALAAGAQDYLIKDALTSELLGRAIRYAVERKRADESRKVLRQSIAERARLERGLLPVPLMQGAGLDCATYYRPGSDGAVLGGDFFDVVRGEDGVVRAVIGDVMGHGPDEAAIGVHLRVAWRTLRMAGAADDEVLPVMSSLLAAEQSGHRRFATVCDLSVVGDVLTVRLAGHPAPIVAGIDQAVYVDADVAPPLGIDADTRWPSTTLELAHGSSVLLYTDGLLDAYTPDGTRSSLGVDELVAAAARCAADRIPVDRWLPWLVAGAPRRAIDDVAAVVLSPGTGR